MWAEWPQEGSKEKTAAKRPPLVAGQLFARYRSMANTDTNPDISGITAKVDCHVPVTGARYGQVNRRFRGLPTEILVPSSAAVTLEIPAIHQFDVGSRGKSYFDDFPAVEKTQIIV